MTCQNSSTVLSRKQGESISFVFRKKEDGVVVDSNAIFTATMIGGAFERDAVVTKVAAGTWQLSFGLADMPIGTYFTDIKETVDSGTINTSPTIQINITRGYT